MVSLWVMLRDIVQYLFFHILKNVLQCIILFYVVKNKIQGSEFEIPIGFIKQFMRGATSQTASREDAGSSTK